MSTINEEKYVCECGKEFENLQSFRGHKSHCKTHYLVKYGGDEEYNNMVESVNDRFRKASKKHSENCKNEKDSKLLLWISEKHTCEKCGKVMNEKYGSGRFCSRACANSREHSEETKNKIRNTLYTNYFNLHPEKFTINPDIKVTKQNKKAVKVERILTYCKSCGKLLNLQNRSGYCRECITSAPERKAIRIAAGKKGYQTAVQHGVHSGWQSRNITSYAERFFIKVLNNNKIPFIREYVVRKEDGINNYFLDFYIEVGNTKLDLEIDGKQHKYEDRKASDEQRDKYLTSLGYNVYRIDWNKLNTPEGKQLMKEKINKFLEFYNSLK